MFGNYIENVRKKKPLIHNITNYVTVNDVANLLLACGASPIMADDPTEAEEITTLCNGLNINIGTLNSRTIESMLAAGKQANVLGHPVLLDPVGAGASSFRTNTAFQLFKQIHFDAIRGNISEIKTLATGGNTTQGVDAAITDKVTQETLPDTISFAKEFARKNNTILAITGAIDLVSDGKRCYCIYNGRPEMSHITGTGCQLSGMTTAFLAANPDNPLEATAAAVCAMGLAGETAWKYMQAGDGNATYRNRIIDAIYHLNGDTLEKGAKFEIY